MTRQKVAYEESLQSEAEGKPKQKPPVNGDGKLVCKKCGTLVMRAQDVKKFYEVHRIVPNYEKTMVEFKIVEFKPQNISKELKKIGKVLCKECDKKWGSMSRNKYGDFPILKIENFRVKTKEKGDGEVYQAWNDFPYELEDFNELGSGVASSSLDQK